MEPKRAKILLEKYRQGLCTEAERRQVEAWYLQASDEMIGGEMGEPNYNRIDRTLRSRLPLPKSEPRRHLVWLPYAAAALLILSIVGYLVFDSQKSVIQNQVAIEILPGGHRATLTLDDGRTLDLSEAQAGIVVGDEITYRDGSVVLKNGNENQDIQYYVLRTPKGGTYQVTLPDGSTVWLNANSTLRYPSQFAQADRVVELTGEAYFDIVSMHRAGDTERVPFQVITHQQIVEVLGTEFNVAAYPEESGTKTTLVEGSVRVQVQATGTSLSLLPGEQGTLVGGNLTKQAVDVSIYTAWHKGDFQFAGDLESVLKQVGRWYNVEITFQDQSLKHKYVSGSLRRNRPLNELLSLLNEVTGAQFSITVDQDERRVKVMK